MSSSGSSIDIPVLQAWANFLINNAVSLPEYPNIAALVKPLGLPDQVDESAVNDVMNKVKEAFDALPDDQKSLVQGEFEAALDAVTPPIETGVENPEELVNAVGSSALLEVAVANFITNHIEMLAGLPNLAALINSVTIPEVIDASNIDEVVKSVSEAYLSLSADQQAETYNELVAALAAAAPAIEESVEQNSDPITSVVEGDASYSYGYGFDDDLDYLEASLAAEADAAAVADGDAFDFGGF
eukprot:tig00020734_g13589.t1